MPAQKRPLGTSTPSPPPLQEEMADDLLRGSENHNQEKTDEDSDSDGSSYSSAGEKDEYIVVKLAEIRKEVQCPICLGIIRKTRTVMECLHRFCRECIDKSMRLGNNECPACRTHCASRRSLRDDPNYDSLIAALYPDIDKYEEEELAFHEEEKARNKQIQASIAQTFRRQAEALGKKRTSARATAAAFSRRQGNHRNLRGRRNQRPVEHEESDEDERDNGHDGSKDSSSADEQSPEAKSKRSKRARSSLTPSRVDGRYDDNDSDTKREYIGASASFVGTDILAWGRGGMRSHNRHGGSNAATTKFPQNTRVSRLIDHVRCSDQIELKINLSLVSLDEEKIPSLKRPYLSCSPTSSVGHLCQYVAMQTSMEASEIEILMMENCDLVNNSLSPEEEPVILNPCNELQLLDEHQTLSEILDSFTTQDLVLAYRKKVKETEDDGSGVVRSEEAVQT